LSALITLARGRQTVVELGTGTAWSAIALARADETRRLITYDPVTRPEREAYLELAGGRVQDRIELREEPDTAGARAGESVELLFVDSSHDRDSVIAAFRAWRTNLMHGAPVVFHDYGNPAYPGVREAVTELRLAGEESYGLFVWRAP
jgi:predicted O-methyltransferase YrrM